MKKVVLVLFMSVLLVMALSSVTVAQGETLLWGMWGSPEEIETHQLVADAFMEANPDVTIEVWAQPWGDYFTLLQTLFAAGDADAIPDVFFLSPVPSYAADGVLMNLDSLIEESGYDVSDYWDGAVQSASWDGSVYGFPRDIGVETLYYNKDHFDEAGLDYPDDTWTWDELRAAAEALTITEASGRVARYGLAMEGGKYFNFVGSNGGMLFDDVFVPTRCALADSEAVEGIEFFADLMNDGFAMRDANLSQAGGDLAVFSAGQTSMFVQNASRVPALNDAGINYDVAPIPIAPGGQRQTNANGAAWVMSAVTDNQELAWEFIQFLQSPEGGVAVYASTGEAFPPTRAGANSETFLNPDRGPANKDAWLMQAEGANNNNTGWFPEWTEIRDTLINPVLGEIWAGNAVAADVLPGMCESVDTFLADAGY